MRDNLIAFIKAFTTQQDGTTHRDEISIGSAGEILLKFGYGYHARNKVVIWNSKEEFHEATIEDAVDEFMTFYKLA